MISIIKALMVWIDISFVDAWRDLLDNKVRFSLYDKKFATVLTGNWLIAIVLALLTWIILPGFKDHVGIVAILFFGGLFTCLMILGYWIIIWMITSATLWFIEIRCTARKYLKENSNEEDN